MKQERIEISLPRGMREKIDAALEKYNERNGPPRLTRSGLIQRLLAEWAKKNKNVS